MKITIDWYFSPYSPLLFCEIMCSFLLANVPSVSERRKISQSNHSVTLPKAFRFLFLETSWSQSRWHSDRTQHFKQKLAHALLLLIKRLLSPSSELVRSVTIRVTPLLLSYYSILFDHFWIFCWSFGKMNLPIKIAFQICLSPIYASDSVHCILIWVVRGKN